MKYFKYELTAKKQQHSTFEKNGVAFGMAKDSSSNIVSKYDLTNIQDTADSESQNFFLRTESGYLTTGTNIEDLF